MTKEDARSEFLRILCNLPYGNSTFYSVKRIEDPIGLLPSKVIIGINKRGIHFFRPVPKEYLHTAELRDIMQFGSNSTAVFFKMRVSGALHVFQFETKQGEEMCMGLQTHISDIMNKRRMQQSEAPPRPIPVAPGYDSTSAKGEESSNGDVHIDSMDSANLVTNDRALSEMKKVLEDAHKRIDLLTSQKKEVEGLYESVKNQLEEAREDLESKNNSVSADGVFKKRLQRMEERALAAEASLASSLNAVGDANESKLGIIEAQMQKTSDEKNELAENLAVAESSNHELETENATLQKKIQRLEKKLDSSSKDLSVKYEGDIKELRDALAREQARVGEVSQELSQTISRYEEHQQQMNVELGELREMQEEQERKDKKTSEIITQQKMRVDELEKLYKEEVVLRKKYFNMMEDMKGKIRVYCRVRPKTTKEEKLKQSDVVSVTDEFTIQHPWKDERKPRSYEFDTCFSPQSSQEDIFHDTRYLIQSAVDGYNVCVFAYGQTGSGKTYTISGTKNDPGLVPRSIEELFDIIKRDRYADVDF